MADVTKTGGNATRAIVIVGGLLIVALVGVIVALVMVLNRPAPVAEPEAPAPRETVSRPMLVTEDNLNEMADEMAQDDPIPDGYYEVTMNYEWHFPDGDSPSTDAYVENSTANAYAVYFDVAMRDSNLIVYKSPVIPVGGRLTNFKLDSYLPTGTFGAVCTYYLVDDNQNVLSSVNMGVSLVIGEG